MMRQDEFLRDLAKIAEINLADKTPNYGLRLIMATINHRLPLLKPVAYENTDLSSGLSGNGIHHICGDQASIKRVQQALHQEAALAPYPMLYRAALARRIEAEAKLAKIQGILES